MKTMNKLWLAVAAIFAQPVSFANTSGIEPPKINGNIDWHAMVCDLLGKTKDCDEASMSNAYRTAMEADAGANSEAVDQTMEELVAANAKIVEVTASVTAANEAKAEADLKVKTIEAMLLAANEKVTKAEATAANARQSLRKFIGAALIKEGRLTKAQWEEEDKKLSGEAFANAEQFDAQIATLSKRDSAIGVTSSIFGMLDKLGEMNYNKGTSQTAANEIQKMVSEEMKSGLTHEQAWANVKATDKGKGLLAQLKQPTV